MWQGGSSRNVKSVSIRESSCDGLSGLGDSESLNEPTPLSSRLSFFAIPSPALTRRHAPSLRLPVAGQRTSTTGVRADQCMHASQSSTPGLSSRFTYLVLTFKRDLGL
ncbi:hypothetical protein RRG08_047900 [Elysia crispata]|uniref:Uncharacterized protein n=1 Tax=Elysia crispata TaxID=231223 RepID=A0AAE1DI66_9GAST|nr:hypothetical protein RRG08_047900 [Elysia crispata]